MDVLYQQYQISNCKINSIISSFTKAILKTYKRDYITQLYFLIDVDNALQYGIETRTNVHIQNYLQFSYDTLFPN